MALLWLAIDFSLAHRLVRLVRRIEGANDSSLGAAPNGKMRNDEHQLLRRFDGAVHALLGRF
jgi:hypothetical protein